MLSTIRILVADDHEGWRSRVKSLLQARPEWQIVCEVSDGLEAVQKAEEFKPDLILLDIGLPGLNGIEAAWRIKPISPDSRIIFLSMNNSADIVQAALGTGAQGYVYKSLALTDLLPAIDAILHGKQFFSSMLRGTESSTPQG